ncbi:MAG: hypothetical protein HOV87_26315 [Catenulispora sp.]|nr:hypothetical protein [Catenulispora sp.]
MAIPLLATVATGAVIGVAVWPSHPKTPHRSTPPINTTSSTKPKLADPCSLLTFDQISQATGWSVTWNIAIDTACDWDTAGTSVRDVAPVQIDVSPGSKSKFDEYISSFKPESDDLPFHPLSGFEDAYRRGTEVIGWHDGYTWHVYSKAHNGQKEAAFQADLQLTQLILPKL